MKQEQLTQAPQEQAPEIPEEQEELSAESVHELAESKETALDELKERSLQETTTLENTFAQSAQGLGATPEEIAPVTEQIGQFEVQKEQIVETARQQIEAVAHTEAPQEAHEAPKNVEKSVAEIGDKNESKEKVPTKEQLDAFQSGKEKILSLHADGKNKSSEYLDLYSHLTEGFGKDIKWRNVSEVDVDMVKKMLDATESPDENLPTEIREKTTAEPELEPTTTKEDGVRDNVDKLATKERTIQTPELLSEKEASKKFLVEDRKKLAEEIRSQRKLQRDRLSALKTTAENAVASTENMESSREDTQYGKIIKLQSAEADELAKRVSSSELNEQDVQDERENISELIASGEDVNLLKAKLEEHYAKADTVAKERFDTLNRSLEHVMKRNNVFVVHKIEEREELRHNVNSNVSSETTYEDDIDIMLAFEPSISASSFTPGEKTKLWPGASGFLLGGGQIGEAGSTDIGTHGEGIKKRGGKNSSIEEIDKVVGRKDKFSKQDYEISGSHTMNEVVVNNAEIFGFFQNAEMDKDGKFWAYDINTIEAQSKDMLKNSISRYRERFATANSRGIPLYVMTPDRNVYECLSVNDDGTIEVGKQLTPEEVSTGRAGLSTEKRKEIGERILEKKIFKKQETQEEAREIVDSL